MMAWLHVRLRGRHRHAVAPSDCPAWLCRAHTWLKPRAWSAYTWLKERAWA